MEFIGFKLKKPNQPDKLNKRLGKRDVESIKTGAVGGRLQGKNGRSLAPDFNRVEVAQLANLDGFRNKIAAGYVT